MFILDDADQLIKQGFQTPIHLLHESLPRCQRLVFTEVIHTKLHRLADPILNYPTIIEAKDASEEVLPITPTQLYQVPNYKTKLNLLNLLMREADIFTKVIVFANSAHTVEKLYKSLNRRITGEVAILRPSPAEAVKLDSPEDFLQAEDLRVLIVNNEKTDTPIPVTEVPYTLHFDIPAEKEKLLERIKIQEDEEADQRLSIIFSTDHDLALVKKAEAETGQEFTVEELPFDLIVEGDPHSKKDDDDEDDDDDKKVSGGGAFHEKKASNAKTYNYKYKDRLKMFGKKHRRHKRGE
jgi:ATP-dependent RNA helicase RhlE